jgi:hypothetical protein
MKSFGKRLAAGLLGLAVVGPAMAGPYTGFWQDLGRTYFDERKHNQGARIREGWESGDLTWREGASILGGRARTELMRRDFMSDGHLSRDEAAALNRAYNDDSRRIRDYKSNPDYRGGSSGRYYGDRYYDDRYYDRYRDDYYRYRY